MPVFGVSVYVCLFLVISRPFDSLQKGDVARNNELVSTCICIIETGSSLSVCQFTVSESLDIKYSSHFRLSE